MSVLLVPRTGCCDCMSHHILHILSWACTRYYAPHMSYNHVRRYLSPATALHDAMLCNAKYEKRRLIDIPLYSPDAISALWELWGGVP